MPGVPRYTLIRFRYKKLDTDIKNKMVADHMSYFFVDKKTWNNKEKLKEAFEKYLRLIGSTFSEDYEAIYIIGIPDLEDPNNITVWLPLKRTTV